MLHAGDQPEVRAAIQATGGRRMAIQALLVRNGIVVHSLRGETPMMLRWNESPLPQGAHLYYRLEIRGPAGHQILSNPIFVQTTEGRR
jgi:hypothetical protein